MIMHVIFSLQTSFIMSAVAISCCVDINFTDVYAFIRCCGMFG